MGLGIDLNKDVRTLKELLKTKKKQTALQRWRNTDILFIDEISMESQSIYDIIKQLSLEFRKDTPMKVIMCGDFCQLPPVDHSSNKRNYCFLSPFWSLEKMELILLTENVRQHNDPLADILHSLREGEITTEMLEMLNDRQEVQVDDHDPNHIFLFSSNKEVDEFNNKRSESLNGESIEIKVDISTHNIPQASRDVHIAKTVKMLGLENFKSYRLKIGTPVFLTKNLDIEQGYFNGRRGVVTEFIKGDPVVKFFNSEDQLTVRKYMESRQIDDPINAAVWAGVQVVSYPIKVCWAMTIHKSQSQTFDSVVVDAKNTFDPEQLYVGMSRATCLNGLYLRNFNISKMGFNPKVLDLYRRMNNQINKVKKEVTTEKILEKVTILRNNPTQTISYEKQKRRRVPKEESKTKILPPKKRSKEEGLSEI